MSLRLEFTCDMLYNGLFQTKYFREIFPKVKMPKRLSQQSCYVIGLPVYGANIGPEDGRC
jgi:hypothetical protein